MKENNELLHNFCKMDETFKIQFSLFYAIDCVNDKDVMEEYCSTVGMAALEWPDILEDNYRRNEWMRSSQWIQEMTQLLSLNKSVDNASPND